MSALLKPSKYKGIVQSAFPRTGTRFAGPPVFWVPVPQAGPRHIAQYLLIYRKAASWAADLLPPTSRSLGRTLQNPASGKSRAHSQESFTPSESTPQPSASRRGSKRRRPSPDARTACCGCVRSVFQPSPLNSQPSSPPSIPRGSARFHCIPCTPSYTQARSRIVTQI